MWKIRDLGKVYLYHKWQSDFAISRGFYFHETSHMRSFAKIKPSQKFPNYQYWSQQLLLCHVELIDVLPIHVSNSN